jgi:Transglycosylase SLT domain
MPLCLLKICIGTIVAVVAFSGHISYAMWARTVESPSGAQLLDSEIENIGSHQSGAPEQASKSIQPERVDTSSCAPIARAAALYGLPLAFFTRLIRQESNFDTKAISRAGAQGIAQFMPATAHWRGLADPFEPNQALLESARWLRELQREFGNLGLAAAAYNAGPRRVKDWIARRGKLPNETRAYVRIITGRTADEWIGRPNETEEPEAAGACGTVAKLPVRSIAKRAEEKVTSGSWAIHLMGDSSEGRVLSEYAGMQKRYHSVLGDRAPMIIKRPIGGRRPSTWYFVRVAESSHDRANQLCSRLKSVGGSCLVSRN